MALRVILSCLLLTTAAVVSPAGSAPEEKFPFVAQVSAKKVNIRAGQSENFETIGRLQKGEKVVVIGRSFSWYEIVLPKNANSYIHADYFVPLGGGVGEATGNRVNVRAGAGIQFSILGQLRKGERARIIQQLGDWFQIEPIETSSGWILAKYLKFSSDAPQPTPVQSNDAELTRMKALEEAKRLRAAEAEAQARQEADYRAQLAREAEHRAKIEAEARRKDAEEAARARALQVSAEGVIEGLGEKALSKNIRHRLRGSDQKVYLLQGHRRIVDGFIHNRVKIEGRIQPDVKAAYPVVLVTKISLVL